MSFDPEVLEEAERMAAEVEREADVKRDSEMTEWTFHRLANETAALVAEKNRAYGSSFDRSGEILKQLYPAGVKPEQYTDMLAMVRIIDKLFRIAAGADTEDPARDITGYGLLMQRANVLRRVAQEAKEVRRDI